MKKRRRLLIILTCWMLMVCSLNSVMASTNEPAVFSGIYMKKNMTLTYFGNASVTGGQSDINAYALTCCKLPENAENVKAVSGNKRILTVGKVEQRKDTKLFQIDVKLRKAGSVKLKVTGTANGKTITDTAKIKVVKYKNPVASFKLGGKEYASRYKTTPMDYTVKKKPGKYKVSCKAASGWRLRSIKTIKEYDLDDVYTAEYDNVKNNSSIKFKKGQQIQITAELYSPKLKLTESVCIVVKEKS